MMKPDGQMATPDRHLINTWWKPDGQMVTNDGFWNDNGPDGF